MKKSLYRVAQKMAAVLYDLRCGGIFSDSIIALIPLILRVN